VNSFMTERDAVKRCVGPVGLAATWTDSEESSQHPTSEFQPN